MATRFDPHAIPVLGIDDHLPPIPPERLGADALRRRFQAPPDWRPEIAIERRFTEREPTHASVLVPLVQRDEVTVLLTQRTDHLTDHPGQISFPGGRAEPEDQDAIATALRESEEEIGLHARHIDVLGSLPTYTTVTSFIVTPVIALVRPGFELKLSPSEVADAFEVPLAHLMDPANHRRHAMVGEGLNARQWFSMPYQDGPQERFVWGATAGMLRNLYRFLSA